MISCTVQGTFNAELAIRTLRVESPKQARIAAQWCLDWVKSKILNRTLPLAPAHGRYATRKSGDTPLVDTLAYVSSFMVRRYGDGFTAGPADQFVSRALALEFGTRRFPARPHWRPGADAVAKEIPRIIERTRLQDTLAKAMKGENVSSSENEWTGTGDPFAKPDEGGGE